MSGQGKDDGQRKKKESIVDLSRFIDKRIRVKFQGGREGWFFVLLSTFIREY